MSDLLAIGQESECSARFKVPVGQRLVSPVDKHKDNARHTVTPAHSGTN
jgi:hypothetical protein